MDLRILEMHLPVGNDKNLQSFDGDWQDNNGSIFFWQY